MKRLEKEIRSNGFTFIQEYRNDRFAIYSQWLQNEIIAFELIIIKKNKDRELFGKHYSASESYPDTKSWGKDGWTFKNYNDAVKRLTEYSKDLRNLGQRVNIEGTFSEDSYKTLASKITALNQQQ